MRGGRGRRRNIEGEGGEYRERRRRGICGRRGCRRVFRGGGWRGEYRGRGERERVEESVKRSM